MAPPDDESPRSGVDPRLRVLYLAAVAVGAFFVHDARIAVALVVAHAIAWLVLRLGARLLLRQFVKLAGFSAFIIASYALTSEEPAIDHWVKLDLHFWKLPLNLGGAAVGALMILRVLAVVLASRIARAMDRWSKLVEPYRSGAREAIARVAARSGLSDDVREIVGRALASS